VGFSVRISALSLICLLLSASSSAAQVADKEQRLQIQKLATEVRELDRCMGVVSVEDIAEFEPVVRAHYRKADELTKAIENYVTRYAIRRST
jgi:hypothetical protein